MSNQLAITRCPGVPRSMLNENERAVVPIPDCPHQNCHAGYAQFISLLEEVGATFEPEQSPLDYSESAEPQSKQWWEERRAAILHLLLPILVGIQRGGESLDDYEQVAQEMLDRLDRHSHDPFVDGFAIIPSPFSLN